MSHEKGDRNNNNKTLKKPILDFLGTVRELLSL